MASGFSGATASCLEHLEMRAAVHGQLRAGHERFLAKPRTCHRCLEGSQTQAGPWENHDWRTETVALACLRPGSFRSPFIRIASRSVGTPGSCRDGGGAACSMLAASQPHDGSGLRVQNGRSSSRRSAREDASSSSSQPTGPSSPSQSAGLRSRGAPGRPGAWMGLRLASSPQRCLHGATIAVKAKGKTVMTAAMRSRQFELEPVLFRLS